MKIRNVYEVKEYAVYAVLGNEIKARGMEDVFFISMDDVSGLEDGARAIIS